MRPARLYEHLHLVNQAELARFMVARALLLPRLNTSANHPTLKGEAYPALEAVDPEPYEDVPGRHPRLSLWMSCLVRFYVIAYPHTRVEEHSMRLGKWVVGVDEATLGTFEMVRGK